MPLYSKFQNFGLRGVIALLLLSGSTSNVMSWQDNPGKAAEGNVLDLEHKWFEALRIGDGLTLDHLMAQDFEGTTTMGKTERKDGWLALFASRMKDASGNTIYRNWRIELRDLRARHYPGVVLVQGIADMRTQHYSESFLHVWIDSGKGWQLVRLQMTAAATSPIK